MAGYQTKASVDRKMKSRAFAVIIVFGVFALFCIAMAIYDITTGRTAFGVMFGLAAIIFVILLLLKVNSVFGTYIRCKNDTLCMKSWVNDFLPYDINGGFFAEMLPARTKITEIPVDEISMILIGTKEYIKRNATSAGKKLLKALYPYEHSSRKTKKNIISSIDLFYVETYDGECSYMCIYGYDPKKVVDVIGDIYMKNPDVYIRVSSKEYRKYIIKLREKLERSNRKY